MLAITGLFVVAAGLASGYFDRGFDFLGTRNTQSPRVARYSENCPLDLTRLPAAVAEGQLEGGNVFRLSGVDRRLDETIWNADFNGDGDASDRSVSDLGEREVALSRVEAAGWSAGNMHVAVNRERDCWSLKVF